MPTGKFAERTKVPATQSRAELEKLLKKYGADAFGYSTEPKRMMIAFRAHGRYLRLTVPMPDEKDEQAHRQRWRALVLVVKAKLEAVASGIVTFEQEFLPWLILPNGDTVAEWAEPQLKIAYQKGQMPTQLLGYRGSEQ